MISSITHESQDRTRTVRTHYKRREAATLVLDSRSFRHLVNMGNLHKFVLIASLLVVCIEANSTLDVFTVGCQDPGTSFTASTAGSSCSSTCLVDIPLGYRFSFDGQFGLLFSLPNCLGTTTVLNSTREVCAVGSSSPIKSFKFACVK
ncbi:uncharacterized protein LOC112340866 [Selaginella moellendorffii]|uniref:uncharacterized protein LOC112340866 n=1 Tax=Selaginella moellendorffii TaxID=88036 RepID=UPI000D1C86AA|nr:uncharacterized protein LOC112340866 [Selaginella moellendorffii]|eukprot:XP_024515782.1 uncharacterized protein LOC112340866 [Selaginella moellendorffii]